MPKVSVIIPVYTVEEYLPRCLNSLLNQTLKDIEIICIDDCSKDNSLEVLNKYAMQDDRIKVVSLKENKGAAFARNKGLEIARGEYLGFVDPDDYVDLDFYEKLYKKALVDGADIVKADFKTIELNGKIFANSLNETILKENNKFLFTYGWTTAIYRKSMIAGKNINFPVECRKGQDIVFLFRCVLNANKISIINNVFYNYIRREDSLDLGKISLNKVISNLIAIKLILEDLNNSALYEENPDLYISVFYMHLSSIFYPLYKNDEAEAKLQCAKYLIELYNCCKDVKKLDEIYEYVILKDHIKNNDALSLAQEFKKYKTRAQLCASNILFKLRMNAKKDLQHN